MGLFISFILIILSVIGYAKDSRIISPLFIVPFIWGMLLMLYNIIPHILYPLQTQFLLSLSIWVLVFFLFCFFTTITDFQIKSRSLYNEKIFNLYFYVILVGAPLTLMLLVVEALKVGPEVFFLKLRMINTGLDDEGTFSVGPLGYIFNISSVVALLFTYYYDRISKKRYYTVIFLAFFLGLITLARTSLVGLSVGIFIVLYFKGKIKAKHFVYFGLIFFAFIILVSVLRGQSESEETSVSDTLVLYIFGSMPAFDTIHYDSDGQFGGYTFRFFYALINAFGGHSEIKQNILPYVDVPVSTNVYTILSPFYYDFGYYGVAIFAAIYGSLFGVVYKLAKQADELMIIMYALLFPSCLLQFFGEYIFANLSTFLQYLFILLITQRIKS